MGLILDLAVVALALVVIGSLALLAWTLGVTAARSVRRERAVVAAARQTVADLERRVITTSARAGSTLEALGKRAALMAAPPPDTEMQAPGDRPDA